MSSGNVASCALICVSMSLDKASAWPIASGEYYLIEIVQQYGGPSLQTVSCMNWDTFLRSEKAMCL